MMKMSRILSLNSLPYSLWTWGAVKHLSHAFSIMCTTKFGILGEIWHSKYSKTAFVVIMRPALCVEFPYLTSWCCLSASILPPEYVRTTLELLFVLSDQVENLAKSRVRPHYARENLLCWVENLKILLSTECVRTKVQYVHTALVFLQFSPYFWKFI